MNRRQLSQLQLWIVIQAYLANGQLEKKSIFEDYFKTDFEENHTLIPLVHCAIRLLVIKGLVSHESLHGNKVILSGDGYTEVDEILKAEPCLLL